MFKKLKIKKLISLLLVFLLFVNSFMSYATSNDGSNFITKAEFDSLKNTFQSQLDEYNKSIDSKIDAAISAYLSSIRSDKHEYDLKSAESIISYPLTIVNNDTERTLTKFVTDNKVTLPGGDTVAVTNSNRAKEKLWWEPDYKWNIFWCETVAASWGCLLIHDFDWKRSKASATDGYIGDPIITTFYDLEKSSYNASDTYVVVKGINENYNVQIYFSGLYNTWNNWQNNYSAHGLMFLEHVKSPNTAWAGHTSAPVVKYLTSHSDANGIEYKTGELLTDTRSFVHGPLFHMFGTGPYNKSLNWKNGKWTYNFRAYDDAGGCGWHAGRGELSPSMMQNGIQVTKDVVNSINKIDNCALAIETSVISDLAPVTYDGVLKFTNSTTCKNCHYWSDTGYTWRQNERFHNNAAQANTGIGDWEFVTAGWTLDAEGNDTFSLNPASPVTWNNKSLIDYKRLAVKVTKPYSGLIDNVKLIDGILYTETDQKIEKGTVSIDVDLSGMLTDAYFVLSNEPITCINPANSDTDIKLRIIDDKADFSTASHKVKLSNGMNSIYFKNMDAKKPIYYKIIWDTSDTNSKTIVNSVTINVMNAA